MSGNPESSSEKTTLVFMAVVIFSIPIYLVLFTYFVETKHVITTFSITSAIASASRAPHAPVLASAKDAFFALVILGALLFFAIVVLRSIHNSKKPASPPMNALARTQWKTYDDWRAIASPAAMRDKASIIRRDLFPTPFRPDTRGNRLPSSLDGFPLTTVGTFMGHFVDPATGDVQDDKPIWLDYEKSVLIVGPPRSGKNYYFLNSMIATHVGPLVTTCVRADLVMAVAAERARLGPVYILDPDKIVSTNFINAICADPLNHPVKQIGWDILDGCTDPKTVESRVNQIIDGATQSSGDNVSDYYGSQIRPIVKCNFYYAAMTGTSLTDAIRILVNWGYNISTHSFLQSLMQSITNPLYRRDIPPLASFKAGSGGSNDIAIAETPVVSDEAQQVIASWLTAIVPTWNESSQQDTFKAFFTGFLTQSLSAFLTPALRNLLDPSSGVEPLDVDLFLKANGTLFIVGNQEAQKIVAPIIVGLISDIYQRAQIAASVANPTNPRLQPPLGFYLDEVLSLAPLPPDLLTGMLTTGSGSGIRLVLVIQDRRMAATKWGPEIAQAVDAQAGAVVLLPGIKDEGLISQYSSIHGTVYVEWDDPNNSDNKIGGDRAVLTAADISGIPIGQALLIIGSHGPMHVAGIPFTERQWYRDTHPETNPEPPTRTLRQRLAKTQ